MKALIFLISIWIAVPLHAQIENPIHWTFTAKKISGTTYEIHLTGAIDAEWHTYSQTTPDGGPVPTVINFSANPLVELNGQPAEAGKLEQHFEKLFGVTVKQFSNKIDFVQKITLKKPVKTNVGGTIYFMVCNDHECLPPVTIPFSVSLS
jgi:thiol:disulfide interchange protein DsbD